MKSPIASTPRTGFRSFNRISIIIAAFVAAFLIATVFAWARPDLAQKVFRGPLSSVGSRIFAPRNARTMGALAPTVCTADDFRSHQTGNWNDVNSWERCDGVNWITPA